MKKVILVSLGLMFCYTLGFCVEKNYSLSVTSTTYSIVSPITTYGMFTQTTIQNLGTGNVYKRIGSYTSITTQGVAILPGQTMSFEDYNQTIYLQSDTATNDVRIERLEVNN